MVLSTEHALRAALVAAYVSSMIAVVAWDHGNRVFWTCAIAALPAVWVAIGFHAWRRVCPLAAFSRLGAALGREGRWLLPARVARFAPLAQLALMIGALSLRHVATNGDGLALASFLLVLALAATLVGFLATGRTWCHSLCPVGLVERIYTEPGRATPTTTTSACAPCTGCVRRCPDLDLTTSHFGGLRDLPRFLAWTAWPGVVLAFYAHFAVAADWDFYFSGAWAYAPPASFSAPLTLVAGALLSCGLFAVLEHALLAAGLDPARTRHRLLVVAGALGFTLFYVFAGQPTLLLAPLPVRVAVMGVIAFVGARAFASRWNAVDARPRRAPRPLPLAVSPC